MADPTDFDLVNTVGDLPPPGAPAGVAGAMPADLQLPPGAVDQARAFSQAATAADDARYANLPAAHTAAPAPAAGAAIALEKFRAAPGGGAIVPEDQRVSIAGGGAPGAAPAAPQPINLPPTITVGNSSSTRTGVKGAKKFRAAMEQIAEKEMAAAEAKHAVDVRRAELDGATAQRQLEVEQQTQADVAARRQEWQAEAQARMADVEAKIAEAGELEERGYRFWRDEKTANKIAAAIGLALGAIGDGMIAKGGGNPTGGAMKVLDTIIARNEAQYRDRVKGLRTAAKSARDHYELAYRMTNDDVAAIQAGRLMQLQAIDRERAAQAAGIEAGSAAEANNLALAAEIDRRKTEAQLALADRFSVTSTKQTVANPAYAAAMKAQMDGDGTPKIPGLQLDPEVVKGLSNTEIADLRKMAGAKLTIDRALDRMETLIDERGYEVFVGSREFKTLSDMIAQGETTLGRQGQTMADDYGRTLESLKSKLSSGVSTRQAVEDYRRSMTTKAAAALAPYGGKMDPNYAPVKVTRGAAE